jgi:Skp family chaperone for outer membrane proteins
MINNQFGRRNLSNYQRSVLALELESVFSERAKENQGQRTDIKQISAESKPIETRKELAKIANVSHDTIAKVKKPLCAVFFERVNNTFKGVTFIFWGYI